MYRPITILAFILLIGNEDTGNSPEVNGQDQPSKLDEGGDYQESGRSQSSIDEENNSGQRNESRGPSQNEQQQDGQSVQVEQEQDEEAAQGEQNEEELAEQTEESAADETKFFMSDQEAAKEDPLIHREMRWRPFAFRWFDHMDNPIFREYKYGFPPGIYGSSLIPISIWYQLWGMKTVDGKCKNLFSNWSIVNW